MCHTSNPKLPQPRQSYVRSRRLWHELAVSFIFTRCGRVEFESADIIRFAAWLATHAVHILQGSTLGFGTVENLFAAFFS